MNEEIERLIFDLEGCCGMFDYMITPLENSLLVSYIKDLQQENKQLKEKYENAVADYESEKSKNQIAIEYINNFDVFKEFSFPLMKRDIENQIKSSIDYEFKTSLLKELLEKLKGDNNE